MPPPPLLLLVMLLVVLLLLLRLLLQRGLKTAAQSFHFSHSFSLLTCSSLPNHEQHSLQSDKEAIMKTVGVVVWLCLCVEE